MLDTQFIVMDQEEGTEYFATESIDEARAALIDLVDEGIAAYIVMER